MHYILIYLVLPLLIFAVCLCLHYNGSTRHVKLLGMKFMFIRDDWALKCGVSWYFLTSKGKDTWIYIAPLLWLTPVTLRYGSQITCSLVFKLISDRRFAAGIRPVVTQCYKNAITGTNPYYWTLTDSWGGIILNKYCRKIICYNPGKLKSRLPSTSAR